MTTPSAEEYEKVGNRLAELVKCNCPWDGEPNECAGCQARVAWEELTSRKVNE